MIMKNALIFGATSAIASETAKQLATQGYSLALAARNADKLQSVIDDIKTVHPATKIMSYNFNASDYSSHIEIINSASIDLGKLDVIIIAHGTLPDNDELKKNFDGIKEAFESNAMSAFSIAEASAKYFEPLQKGTIVVISSVAGDRGRQSNYIYGAAKGAVSIYFQGLRNRLSKSNVHVVTVKPGFVDTPMTANVPKNFLFAKPADIAKGIINAIDKKKDVVYLPFFWKYIMMIIKSIPEGVFKRLSL
jgi:decaprenylphospho-beta-D-erythro-pentofuranosid-2-ulose 2-reductase